MHGVTIIPLNGKTPIIHDTAFIAPGCVIIGDVEIGAGASIWYNCVLRGDVNSIRVGARTNIQDGTIIHCDSPKPQRAGFPTVIGEDCLVGHIAMVHGCTIMDKGFVGLGAIIMDGCVVEPEGMLAAGAMLTPGKVIGAGQLWGGRPAKYMRDLSADEITGNNAGVAHYVDNGRNHAEAIKAL